MKLEFRFSISLRRTAGRVQEQRDAATDALVERAENWVDPELHANHREPGWAANRTGFQAR